MPALPFFPLLTKYCHQKPVPVFLLQLLFLPQTEDIAILDKMYELNLTYFKELSMYVLAGKRKLEEVS